MEENKKRTEEGKKRIPRPSTKQIGLEFMSRAVSSFKQKHKKQNQWVERKGGERVVERCGKRYLCFVGALSPQLSALSLRVFWNGIKKKEKRK